MFLRLWHVIMEVLSLAVLPQTQVPVPLQGRRWQVVRGCCSVPGPSPRHALPPNPWNLTELLTIFASKGCQLTSRTQALWLVSFFTMWPLRRSYTVQERPEWRGATRPSSHPSSLPEQDHLPASQPTSHFPRGAKPTAEVRIICFFSLSLLQVEGMV